MQSSWCCSGSIKGLQCHHDHRLTDITPSASLADFASDGAENADFCIAKGTINCSAYAP